MKKKERAEKIKEILDHLFPNPVPPLKHTDAYTLLIATLLAAQCTDERVNKVTPTLFSLAKTPNAMAALPEAKIREVIHSCGFYNNKAKAIKSLSQILVDEYNGKVPKTLTELEKLPGVGHKTASVVMCQAFKEPAFPIDTHIHRCAKRWKLSTGKNVVQTEKDLKQLYNREDWIKLHLQIIYFARQYCPAKCHDPSSCPICSWI